MKTYQRIVTAKAVQVTDATFDAPHPNPEHVIGVTYDPRRRVAIVPIDGFGETHTASLGDWIVREDGDEHARVLSAEAFAFIWAPPASTGERGGDAQHLYSLPALRLDADSLPPSVTLPLSGVPARDVLLALLDEVEAARDASGERAPRAGTVVLPETCDACGGRFDIEASEVRRWEIGKTSRCVHERCSGAPPPRSSGTP